MHGPWHMPEHPDERDAAAEEEAAYLRLLEAHAEHGCGFIDCVNNPGCDPGDENCPAIRAARQNPKAGPSQQ